MTKMRGFVPKIRLIVLAVLLTGCGNRLPAGTDLQAYAKGLPAMDAVYEKFDLEHIGSGVGEDGVHLEVRKRRDPMKPTPDKEIERIKQAIYEEYGRKFPLRINVWQMPQTPTLEGTITAMDEQGILVVAPPVDAESSPRAMWLRWGSDTVMLNASSGEELTADRLKVGFNVRAWSEPLVAMSYPEQSGLLRLEVKDSNVGNGDLQGTVTKMGIGFEETTERELQIDGKAYRVLHSAMFRKGDAAIRFEDLKEGDRVSVWFAGYAMEPGDQIITQVVVTPHP
ncbi:hypothetical protein GE107_18520 [Cohnella sp. CFH 77786]|uniref:hypothetical protein n=1 Tax=Cohnella sp. CFH 77786 TaxID=2662265 RepID=UPI001C609CC3|nr:hypothetical protein [Cohnella sp. CFH 77786]MBW5448055.1 hypothetical protein [Cohnella sp. CFH 77786]